MIKGGFPMMTTMIKLYKWWTGRFKRYYKEAQEYYSQLSNEALLAEWIELEIRKDKYSRRWELLLGLVLTIVFSDDLKRLLAIVFSQITGVVAEELQDSVLMSLVVTLLIVLLLIAIIIYNFSHAIVLRRYLILKHYLEEHDHK